MTGDELDNIMFGLHENQLDNYDYLLTGFISSEETLGRLLNILKRLKSVNPSIKYVCDPVLGDDGTYYVPQSLVPIFIQKILPEAFMITPNQFEAELLSGKPIFTESDCIDCLKSLQQMGPSIVVITSVELKSEPGKLFSYILDASTTRFSMKKIVINKLPGIINCLSYLILLYIKYVYYTLLILY